MKSYNIFSGTIPRQSIAGPIRNWELLDLSKLTPEQREKELAAIKKKDLVMWLWLTEGNRLQEAISIMLARRSKGAVVGYSGTTSEIALYLRLYIGDHVDRINLNQRPNPQVRADIEKLQQLAKKASLTINQFQNMFNSLKHDVRDVTARAYAIDIDRMSDGGDQSKVHHRTGSDILDSEDRFLNLFSEDGNHLRCLSDLAKVVATADAALIRFPGQAREDSMRLLMDQLAEMWKSVTGAKPSLQRNGNESDQAPPFSEFIDIILEILPKKYRDGFVASRREVVRRKP